MMAGMGLKFPAFSAIVADTPIAPFLVPWLFSATIELFFEEYESR